MMTDNRASHSEKTAGLSSQSFQKHSTGVRLFIILLLALSPLALVAYLASKQIEANEDQARQSAAASALNLGALRITTAINVQKAALLRAANSIALGGNEAAACNALREELGASRLDQVLVFADNSGGPICDFEGPSEAIRAVMLAGSADEVQLVPEQGGVILFWQGRENTARASAYISIEKLVEIADPASSMPLAHIVLHDQNRALVLGDLPLHNSQRLGDRITAQQAIAGLDLTMQLPAERKSSSEYLIRIIPFIIVLLAAIIGWLVVNRMLMRPIQRLQDKMLAFAPGDPVQPMYTQSMTASEIIALDGAFNRLATKVQDDQKALAHGLSEQVALTREVHHRVKNNLQIITSLLSLHARGAENESIARVYASIQRRVNALAVVHRNHFANSEAQNGIALRELICEVVTSFRARDPANDLDKRTSIVAEPELVDQDVAMPVAFLLTEILELIQNSGAPGPITIAVQKHKDGQDEDDKAGIAELSITAPALGENATIDALLQGGIGKILQGLSRQLRSTLVQDRVDGRFAISIALFDHPDGDG